MKYSGIQLIDLPDEILLIIFQKLNNIELFYSLISVHQRLDNVLHDSIFTNTLTLLEKFSPPYICSLSAPVLDRFCSQILPDIEYKIKWLNLDGSSLERILSSGNFSSLSGLGVYGITKIHALHLLTDETLLTHKLKKQISSLVIQTTGHDEYPYVLDGLTFTNVINTFSNLKCLNLHPCDVYNQRISPSNIHLSVYSSTLRELSIHVHSIDDCFYFLDGRFDQLRVFNVKMMWALRFCSVSDVDQIKSLNLRSFSLSCFFKIDYYDEILIPLLHRMLNLEELRLYLKCSRRKSFIDGNNLKANIIDFLPRLKTFAFVICSMVIDYSNMNLLTNEDIQNTFREFPNKNIISYVDYFPNKNESQCYVYSFPFTLTSYERITNNFPDGLFTFVRKISLFDERAFEHDFFRRIQKSFPFMEDLTVANWQAQNEKLQNVNEYSTLIHYHHLTSLDLLEVHDDYIEEFLLDTKTSLPFNVTVYVYYEAIQRITHDFQRTETRINCSKINCVYSSRDSFPPSKHFKKYFLRFNT